MNLEPFRVHRRDDLDHFCSVSRAAVFGFGEPDSAASPGTSFHASWPLGFDPVPGDFSSVVVAVDFQGPVLEFWHVLLQLGWTQPAGLCVFRDKPKR